MLMRKYFGIVLMLMCSSVIGSYAQHTWSVDKLPMSWRHFTKKNTNVSNNAVALTYIDIKMESEVVSNGSDHKLMLLITLDQSKKNSWVSTQFLRRATDNESIHVLNHERLHLAINYIHFLKLRDTLQDYTFTRNYKAELASIFQKIQGQNKILNSTYDRMSMHSLNAVEQKNWEEDIMRTFNEYFSQYSTLPTEFYIQKNLPENIQ